jgi:lipopolysaccharide transport system permease protein
MPTKISVINADASIMARLRPTSSVVSIRAGSTAPILNVRELWAYREVLYALVWRDIKIRYAQTVVGVGWAVLQPALTTVVLTLLAGRWMRTPAHGLSYSLFAFAGLAPWIYFTHVLTKASICLVNNNGLLSKAYFPRLLLPLSTAIGGLVDLFVTIAILALLMAYHRTVIGFHLLLLPCCLLLLIMVAIGSGIWIAVLNLYHRDVAHALPFATQLLFFMTPIAYSSSLVPQSWRLAYSLNPMVGVIECFRWALFASPPDISLLQLSVSMIVGAVLLVAGLFYFSREEKTLADVGNI